MFLRTHVQIAVHAVHQQEIRSLRGKTALKGNLQGRHPQCWDPIPVLACDLLYLSAELALK